MLFSIQILIKNILKIYFFSVWQNLGFGECGFSIEILIKKELKICLFSAFGKILVLANAFFY